MGRRYAPEQRAWLEAHLPDMANEEAARAFSELFGADATARQMHAYCSNHGIRKTKAARARPHRAYTDEEEAFLREAIPGRSEREIIAAFAERFGRELKVCQVANMKAKLGVKSGTNGGRFEKGHVPWSKGMTWDEQGRSAESRAASLATCYKPGQLPHNVRPLLDMREGKDGYLQIHVGLHRREKANDQWIGYGQFVWMQANGRDWPDGHRCIFADGDNRNFDPENIVAVPGDLYPIVQGAIKGQMPWHDRETLELAITSARITQARARLEKKAREGR